MRNNLEEILTKKKIYACIFARGGSKGVKRKNLKTLGDKPLISYSIDSARSNKYIDNVFVSTGYDRQFSTFAGTKKMMEKSKNVCVKQDPFIMNYFLHLSPN